MRGAGLGWSLNRIGAEKGLYGFSLLYDRITFTHTSALNVLHHLTIALTLNTKESVCSAIIGGLIEKQHNIVGDTLCF